MAREERNPRRQRQAARRPGQMYREIIVQRDITEREKDQLFVKGQPRFVRVCKRLHGMAPSLGRGAAWPESYRDAMAFLNWDLSPEEFDAAHKVLLFALLFLFFLLGLGLLLAPVTGELLSRTLQGMAPLLMVVLFPVLFPLLIWHYFRNYPFSVVVLEQRKALGHVPELVGYIVMAMKLTPNLEKASEFAAEHGRGKIASDFKKMLWNVQLGVHNTLAEGLDEIAWTWGKYSTEFKRALMRVRASVLEDTEAKRDMMLNKTMEDLLLAVREKMEAYARDLKQPSIVLFYIGVLLPIILIIILPIGSAFTSAPFATAPGLIGIYNIAIPFIAFIYARSIIKHRPPTYEVPKIPDDYPGLPKRGTIKTRKGSISIVAVIAIVLVVGAVFTWFLHTEGFPPKAVRDLQGAALDMREVNPLIPPDQLERDVIFEAFGNENYFEPEVKYNGEYSLIERYHPDWDRQRKLQELEFNKKKFFFSSENDVTPYNLVFGTLITGAICFFLWFNYTNIYRRKAQEKIMQMETEFKDALYIIASRLGENKPLEDAIKHAREFLPNYVISDRIFSRILDNIHLLGMPIDSAVFDTRFGALVNIPSDTIRVGMKLVVDSVKLGVNVAARTLVSLSLQMDNQEKVAKMLKVLVTDLTQMMRTMAIIITPLVLGITTALYSVVMQTLMKVSFSSTLASTWNVWMLYRFLPGITASVSQKRSHARRTLTNSVICAKSFEMSATFDCSMKTSLQAKNTRELSSHLMRRTRN